METANQGEFALESIIIPMLNITHWVSACGLIAIALYCYFQERNKISKSLMLFCLFCSHWAICAGLIFLAPNLEAKIFLNQIKFLTIPLIPISIFLLITALYARSNLHRWSWRLIFLVPFITLLINFFDHDLLIREYHLISSGGFQILGFKNGPWFVIHVVFSQVLTLVALILIFAIPQENTAIKRKERLLVFTAILVPMLTDSIAVHYFPSLRYIQMTPVALFITALLLFQLVIKEKIFSIIPYARSLALDASDNIYLIFNQKNQLVDFNKEAKDLLNISAENINQDFDDLSHIHSLENHTLKIKDKTYRQSIRSIYDNNEQGSIIGKILCFTNTDLEEKLKSNLEELSQYRSRILGVLAHDLKGHLASIDLTAESISSLSESGEAIQDKAQRILNINSYAYKLIEETVEWSRLHLNRLKLNPSLIRPGELMDELDDFFKPLLLKKNIELKITCPQEEIFTDKNILLIILRNLLSNAIKFSPLNSAINFSCEKNLNSYNFKVLDQGPGVEEDLFKKIELNHEMTSFGLVTAYDFSKKIKGELNIKNTPLGTLASLKIRDENAPNEGGV